MLLWCCLIWISSDVAPAIVVTSYMVMPSDVAHAIFVTSYMNTSSDVAHGIMVTSYMDMSCFSTCYCGDIYG
jgi:hypothetical protein